MNFIDDISSIILLKRRNLEEIILMDIYKKLSQRVHEWDEAWDFVKKYLDSRGLDRSKYVIGFRGLKKDHTVIDNVIRVVGPGGVSFHDYELNLNELL